MALTLFLFKVSNLDAADAKVESHPEGDDQSVSDTVSTQFISDEDAMYLVAKVIFRGMLKRF